MTNKRYLFRGFHPDENGKTTIKINGEKICGEWVYGGIFERQGDEVQDYSISIITPSLEQIGNAVKVVPETLGQWVITDQNGKDVFEKDLVRKYADGKEVVCVIEFDKEDLQYKAFKNMLPFRLYAKDWELIGSKWECAE